MPSLRICCQVIGNARLAGVDELLAQGEVVAALGDRLNTDAHGQAGAQEGGPRRVGDERDVGQVLCGGTPRSRRR